MIRAFSSADSRGTSTPGAPFVPEPELELEPEPRAAKEKLMFRKWFGPQGNRWVLAISVLIIFGIMSMLALALTSLTSSGLEPKQTEEARQTLLKIIGFGVLIAGQFLLMLRSELMDKKRETAVNRVEEKVQDLQHQVTNGLKDEIAQKVAEAALPRLPRFPQNRQELESLITQITEQTCKANTKELEELKRLIKGAKCYANSTRPPESQASAGTDYQGCDCESPGGCSAGGDVRPDRPD